MPSVHRFALRGKREMRSSSAHPRSNQQARRQRTRARRLRRFESTISALRGRVRLPRLSLPREFAVPEVRWSGWQPSKVLSLALILFVGGSLSWLHVDDGCFIYREDVRFSSLSYLSDDELYDTLAVDSWNALWLAPETVRANLLRYPYVVDAQVSVRLPGTIVVDVQEVQPVAIWLTDAGPFWVTEDGMALPVREGGNERIPQIIDGAQLARSVEQLGRDAVDMEMLTTVRTLIELMPTLTHLRIDPQIGLNFPLPEQGILVRWGSGQDLETKLRNLTAAQQVLARGEATGNILDLRSLKRPYFE